METSHAENEDGATPEVRHENGAVSISKVQVSSSSSSSHSTMAFPPPPRHTNQSSPYSRDQLQREAPKALLLRALRRFAIGYSLNSGFTLLQLLLRYLFDHKKRVLPSSSSSSFARQSPAPRSILPQQLKQIFITSLTHRNSKYLGSFMALYGLIYHITRKLLRVNTKASRSVEAAIAGAAAGCSMHVLTPLMGGGGGGEGGRASQLLDPTALSLHALVRGLEAVARQSGAAKTIPHADSLMFILSSWLIMYCWFYHPSSLSPAYSSWITAMAEMDGRLLNILRALKQGTVRYGEHTSMLESYCIDHGCPPSHADFISPSSIPVPCSVIHPSSSLSGGSGVQVHKNLSCASNVGNRIARGTWSAMALYMPVHVVAQILVHRKELARRMFPGPVPSSQEKEETTTNDSTNSTSNKKTTKKTTSNTTKIDTFLYILNLATRSTSNALRSSAFLGLFIGFTWGGVCLSRRCGPHDATEVRGPLLGSFLSGFSILAENPHRRADLAAYVAPRALQSAWDRLERAGFVKSFPGAHVTIFSLACSLLMSSYETARQRQFHHHHQTCEEQRAAWKIDANNFGKSSVSSSRSADSPFTEEKSTHHLPTHTLAVITTLSPSATTSTTNTTNTAPPPPPPSTTTSATSSSLDDNGVPPPLSSISPTSARRKFQFSPTLAAIIELFVS